MVMPGAIVFYSSYSFIRVHQDYSHYLYSDLVVGKLSCLRHPIINCNLDLLEIMFSCPLEICYVRNELRIAIQPLKKISIGK